MSKEENSFKLRTAQIPVIILNKITVIEEEDYVSIFYGINNIDQDKEAMDIVLKEGLKYKGINHWNPNDFKKGTEYKNQKWNIKNSVNVYQNTNVNKSNSILKENNKSFERAYWLIKIKE
tara:strand:- start:325 stop:684 length:360 start_codon:yes stop_codon:yes gene_type:complete